MSAFNLLGLHNCFSIIIHVGKSSPDLTYLQQPFVLFATFLYYLLLFLHMMIVIQVLDYQR